VNGGTAYSTTVSSGAINSGSSDFIFGARNSTSGVYEQFSPVQISNITYEVNSVVSNSWDAALSSHSTGTPTLIDTVSANNATGVNMPTDSSAWIATFPDRFTLLGNIEAPFLTGAATGVPLLVKPNTEFTAAMLLNLDAGGGDLRFSSDAAGLNQLPCEVVDGLDVVWVKPTGVSISTGATLYVWGDNTGASQPAVGAAFGRNAVWSDYFLSSLDGGFLDSSGNITPVPSGGISGGTATGNIYKATAFDGTDDEFEINAVQAALQARNNLTISAWIYPTAYGDAGKAYISQICGDNVSTLDGTAAIRLGADGSDANKDKGYFQVTTTAGRLDVTTTGAIPLNTWSLIEGVLESNGDIKIYVNGTLSNTNATGSTKTIESTHTGSYRIGDENARGRNFTGSIAGISLLPSKSPDQISIEHDNQSELGSWWIASDVGGISITESVVNSNYISLDPVILLTGSISVTESLVNTNYTAINPVVTLTGSISITESVVNTNYTSLNPAIDLTGIISVTESLVNSNYTSLDPVITLTSGAIEIIESTAGTQYASINPSILLTPEPLGIVSTVCFNGELANLEYSGESTSLEYDGKLEATAFNGEFNALEFSGTIQTTCADGDIKTNC
jgi:hypothetical protein